MHKEEDVALFLKMWIKLKRLIIALKFKHERALRTLHILFPITKWRKNTSSLIIFSNGFSFHVFINLGTSSINDDALLPDILPPFQVHLLQLRLLCLTVKVFHTLSLQLKIQNNAGTGQRYHDWARFSVPLSSVCRLKSTESSWSRGRSSWRLTQQRSQLPPLKRRARRNEDRQHPPPATPFLCFSLRWINC